ncbi:Glucanosyltransferase-domain-containing protein [Xylariales sp. AK1849]|nr:Glucanosyltransferase-domain-containing protein [Xylariales sp. AK1849]
MLIQSALVVLGASLAAAVPSLTVQGAQFVNSNTGDAFQIVGMAYQIGGSAGYDPSHGKDPLSNGDVCKRDAALMQVLGINTIRVYNLDPNLNHDDCASVFNAAGMYMLIDVNSPLAGESINSAEPWTSYYTEYLNRTFAIVESFKSYPNTLGFFSGNEVISDVATGSTVPPYVRAVTRDLKQYIKNHADRAIPVGYSAADVRDVLEDSWNYFQCAIDGDADDMSRADMFALNSYSWCGNSSFTESGYDQLVAMFQDTSVPVFYSEFGCNKPSPRVFTEIQSIYGSDMMGTFSGGVVYEFAQEPNNFGLATVNSDNTVDLRADYNTLKEQYANVEWSSVQSVKASTTTKTPPTCSSSLIKEDGFSNNFTLPAVPEGAQDIIDNGVSPKPVGKIVDISDYSFSYEIKDVTGSVLSIAVSPLADDATNTAGTNNGTATSSSSSPSGTGNAAFKTGAHAAAIAIPVLAGFMAVL